MNRFSKVLAGASAFVLSLPVYAVDYTSAATAADTEVDAAIAAALPVGIVVMAAVIGWRLFKRFARG